MKSKIFICAETFYHSLKPFTEITLILFLDHDFRENLMKTLARTFSTVPPCPTSFSSPQCERTVGEANHLNLLLHLCDKILLSFYIKRKMKISKVFI